MSDENKVIVFLGRTGSGL